MPSTGCHCSNFTNFTNKRDFYAYNNCTMQFTACKDEVQQHYWHLQPVKHCNNHKVQSAFAILKFAWLHADFIQTHQAHL